MGPTAAGKTALSFELVEKFDCEIISVDSALVFRQMDIGTAKPDADTLSAIPHHLINICDPTEAYSAYRFRDDALQAMDDIRQRGKTPLLVGGTMLYYKALLEPMADLPPGNDVIRHQLSQQFEAEGLAPLVEELMRVDPAGATRIHLQNPQRVMRALEVFRLTGRPISELWQEGEHDGKGGLSETALEKLPYQLAQFVVMPEQRTVLHQRIEQRFHQMLDMGFEQEVRSLRQRGDLNPELMSMRSVGYRQMWQYLDDEYSYEEMVQKGMAATRQLAKRQFTWLRKWPRLNVMYSDQLSLAEQCQFVSKKLRQLHSEN